RNAWPKRVELLDASAELGLRPAIGAMIARVELAFGGPVAGQDPVGEHRTREDAHVASRHLSRDRVQVLRQIDVVDELEHFGPAGNRRARDLDRTRANAPAADPAGAPQLTQEADRFVARKRTHSGIVQENEVDDVSPQSLLRSFERGPKIFRI